MSAVDNGRERSTYNDVGNRLSGLMDEVSASRAGDFGFKSLLGYMSFICLSNPFMMYTYASTT